MASTEWQTPKVFFEIVQKALPNNTTFAVDAAAQAHNTLVQDCWYGPGSPYAEDALQVDAWPSPAWCNPPYLGDNAWKEWLDKFAEQGALGCHVVTLLPAKTGTLWWAEKVVAADCDILFLTGRLPFTLPHMKKSTKPNHDSALVVWGPTTAGRVAWINWKDGVEKYDHQSNS